MRSILISFSFFSLSFFRTWNTTIYCVFVRQYLEQESTEVESESTKETSSRKKFPRKEKPLKSPPKKIASPSVLPKIEASIMQEAIIRLLPDPDPMTEFSKIPPSDKLELLDPLTRYEYKIQTILLLEKILDIHESPKVKGKSPKKKEETVSFSFRDIDPELIAEVLQQRFLRFGEELLYIMFNYLLNIRDEIRFADCLWMISSEVSSCKV